ncbi:hypothetical protein GCM10018783_45470 [Streptomyces griseosporeus]|nr:hypothetical protein GCM10018783_45470 [Streptomyces griseosporeus]
MLVPVAQDTSGQSDSTEQASKPRVIESPTAAIESGLRFHDGVGLAEGRDARSGPPEDPGEWSPAASHPAAPSTTATTTASPARARRLGFRIPADPLGPDDRTLPSMTTREGSPVVPCNGSHPHKRPPG